MNGDAIVLADVGKRYWKLDEQGMLLRSILPFRRPVRSHLWALRHVDLRVGQAETIGVMGANGSGKTTMLRLLCGVSAPTEGHVRVVGRTAPLIGVGVGFQREMSGRENVFVNGHLLGLTQEEITARFDDIVAFAELADFIETPVKFYSSGMFVRLGFSVAVHCDPQVLLVDEVLAVGDITYQMKCVERMRHLQDEGCTVVLVSHSIASVRAVCPRAIVMRRGQIEYDGATEGAIGRYHEVLSEHDEGAQESGATGTVRPTVGGARIVERSLHGPDGPISYAERGVPLEMRISIRFERSVESPLFGVNIFGQDGRTAYGVHSPVGIDYRRFAAGETADVRVRFVPSLGGGTYRVTSTVATADGRQILAADHAGVLFYVEHRPHEYGTADLEGVVSVDGVELVEFRASRLERANPAQRASDERRL